MSGSLLRLLSVSLLLTTSGSRAARVIYVNQPEGAPGIGAPGVIQTVNPDGSGHAAYYTAATVTDLRGIAVDPENNRLFFAYCELASGVNPIQVSLRTLPLVPSGGGASPVTILSLADGTPGSASNPITDVEYDRTGQHVYFALPATKLLRRCDAAGGNLTTVLTHPGAGTAPRDLGPYFFGLDLENRNVYWGVLTIKDDTNTPYSKGSLAGVVDPAFSLTTPSRTRDIAVDPYDPGGPRLYWNDRQDGIVYTRLSAGGSVQSVVTGLNAPHGLALDLIARKGYLSDTGKRGSGTQLSAHRVVRFNLDGTGSLEFLSPVSSTAEPWDLALDLSSSSFSDWKRRFFAQGEANSDLDDDPDGDGLSNLGEYAFFCNPMLPDAHKANQVFALAPTRIRVALLRQTDLVIRVEVSRDLKEWHWNGDSTGLTHLHLSDPQPRDEDSQWFTVTPTIQGERSLFLRVTARPGG